MQEATSLEHELLLRGTQAHQSGKLTEAAELYRQVLDKAPGHPEALFLLGSIANTNRRYDLGAQLIEQAVAARGNDARYHTELGIAYQNMKRDTRAARHFRKAIDADPGFAFAWFNLGNRYIDLGATDKAIRYYKKACVLEPTAAEYQYNLAVTLQQTGKTDDAIRHYLRALDLHPDFPDALLNLAALHTTRDEWKAALDRYQQVLHSTPGDMRALHGQTVCYQKLDDNDSASLALMDLGNLYLEQGDTTNAIACLEKAAQLATDRRNALYNLGVAFMHAGENALAEETFKLVTELDPEFERAINNLGMLLQQAGHGDSAVEHFNRAARLGSPHAHINLGNHHSANGRRDAARQAYTTAAELDPGSPDAWLNLANEELLCGNPEASETALRNAISHCEAHSQSVTSLGMAHTNLADLLLGQGRYREGWREYQWRHGEAPCNLDDLKAQLSSSRPLVIVPDQGLGDEIFFLRFAAAVQNRYNTALQVYVSDRLASLLGRCLRFDVRAISTLNSSAPNLLRVGDLPLLADMHSSADIPASLSLAADPARVARYTSLLSDYPGPFLGVTWRAGTERVGSLKKQVPFAEFCSAIKDWPGTVLILQRSPEETEVQTLVAQHGKARVIDLSQANQDLENILAVLSLLDEYAGVSNTNMHLYAALGKSARCLAPCPADWRWASETGRSPWFPDFPLYRQTATLDWSEALAGLRADLTRH